MAQAREQFVTYYQRRLTNKLTDVLHDATHPLKTDFDNKIIQRSGRLRVPRTRTARCAGSFVTSAIKGFNTRIGRTRNDNEWLKVYGGDYNC